MGENLSRFWQDVNDMILKVGEEADTLTTVDLIMPPCEQGVPVHEDYDRCWCGPRRLYTTAKGTEVWTHRKSDGSGPPPSVVAEVIAAAVHADPA